MKHCKQKAMNTRFDHAAYRDAAVAVRKHVVCARRDDDGRNDRPRRRP